MVYVLNVNGQPLMPTKRYGKVRRMLKSGKAKVIKRCPFTIQLLYESTNHTQELTLGVDAGSKTIGISVSNQTKEYYSSEVILRNDISKLLTDRRKLRSSRRNRKLRYRKARFCNRVHSKHKGWLAPSIEHKIQTHMKVINDVCKILPVSNIVVETASFDIQLLKARLSGGPLPQGIDYQQGQLYNWNLREYIFWRDNYTCQWCKGKSKSKILHIHHWNYWRGDHTNKPDSLITLCDVCNDSKNHKPEAKMLWGWQPKITHNFQDAAFMGIMRWTFYNRVKAMYPNVSMTFGYITKNTRISNGLPKEHRIDALCIANHPQTERNPEWFCQKKVRCHNRQIHKCSILKGGIRKRNTAPYKVKGYSLFDKVCYENKEYFIFGRRSSGCFDIRTLSGEKVNKGSINSKKLQLCETNKHYLLERRQQAV